MTSNLTEQIYERLKQCLFAFEFEPGERLSEKVLAAQWGVSRTPVREALFRLLHEGYVEVLPRAGWQVRNLDFEQIDQLYEVRVLLEIAALTRLADVEILVQLRELWCVPDTQRIRDGMRVWQMDEDFHTGLVASAGNRELSRIHEDITERLRIVRRLDFTKPMRIDATYEEHGAILRHLLAGRVRDAQDLLRAHIETSQAEVHKITLSALHQARKQTAMESSA